MIWEVSLFSITLTKKADVAVEKVSIFDSIYVLFIAIKITWIAEENLKIIQLRAPTLGLSFCYSIFCAWGSYTVFLYLLVCNSSSTLPYWRESSYIFQAAVQPPENYSNYFSEIELCSFSLTKYVVSPSGSHIFPE